MKQARRSSSHGVVRDSLRDRRRRKTRRVLISYVLAAGVIYGGAWHLAHYPTFEVAGVSVEGNVVTSDAGVAAAARAALASPALSLLPMTNAYLARADVIEAAILGALPEVAAASVSRQGQDLVVKVEERERAGYWCREKIAEVINERSSVNDLVGFGGRDTAAECYALDASGFIFAREAPPLGATRYSGLVAAADPIRERYASGETWENLSAVVSAFRGRAFTPLAVSTRDGVDFRISLAEGPYLLVDATRPGAGAIENLAIALDDESLASLRGYEYADLRLSHKVFLRAVVTASE